VYNYYGFLSVYFWAREIVNREVGDPKGAFEDPRHRKELSLLMTKFWRFGILGAIVVLITLVHAVFAWYVYCPGTGKNDRNL